MKVTNDKDLKFEKTFNMEQLSIESQRLRHIIEEKMKPLDKIEKMKKNVSEKDIKALRKFRTQRLKAV